MPFRGSTEPYFDFELVNSILNCNSFRRQIKSVQKKLTLNGRVIDTFADVLCCNTFLDLTELLFLSFKENTQELTVCRGLYEYIGADGRC
jgi:hypothetical protein